VKAFPTPEPETPPTAAELAAAIDDIVANWEHGDLAGAVNAARELVEKARAFQAAEARA